MQNRLTFCFCKKWHKLGIILLVVNLWLIMIWLLKYILSLASTNPRSHDNPKIVTQTQNSQFEQAQSQDCSDCELAPNRDIKDAIKPDIVILEANLDTWSLFWIIQGSVKFFLWGQKLGWNGCFNSQRQIIVLCICSYWINHLLKWH